MPKKFSEEMKKDLCTNWKASGLSKLQFAKINNISESALRRWIKKIGQVTSADSNLNSSNNIKFLALDKSSESKQKNSVEIVLPNKISINIEVDSISNLIMELMK